MKTLAIQYFATLLSMICLDAIWLSTRIESYKSALGQHLAEAPFVPALVFFYLLYAFGVCMLVPGTCQDWKEAFLRGLLFGIVAYGTYDLTNAGTLRQFPLSLAFEDMLWGGFLTAVASSVSYYFMAR